MALRAGRVVAVAEHQGAVLRAIDQEDAHEAVRALAIFFRQKRIFPDQQSLCVKDYPETLGKALEAAGFRREVRDYILWREL